MRKKELQLRQHIGANFISALGNAHKNFAMDTSAIHNSSARNSSIMLSSTSDIKVLLGEVLNKDCFFFLIFFLNRGVGRGKGTGIPKLYVKFWWSLFLAMKFRGRG